MEFQDKKGNRLELIRDGVAQLEENREYRLVIPPGEAARDGWKGWLGGLELSWDKDAAAFAILTSHWIGSQTLRIQGPLGEKHLEVEVHPRKDKLSGDAWVHLLRELNAWLPGSTVGREGGLHGEVGFSGSDVAGVASVLGDLVPAFVAALEALTRAPRERSTEQWSEGPVHAVRQADRNTLRWLVRHPEAWQGVQGYAEVSQNGREALVPQREWRGDFDHAANRYVAWIVGKVASRLRETSECMEKGLKRQRSLDPDLTRWCRERIDRLEEGAQKLRELLRRPPLKELSREPASESALLMLVDDPVYARVHAFGQLFLSPRFQLPEDDSLLGAPVRPSYELYELWTFLALRRLLDEAWPGALWTSEEIDKLKYFDQKPNGASFTARWTGHGALGLHFNLEFPGFLAKERGPRWSISGARRPDLVVTWEPETGQGQWLCLDAKYRTGARSVGESFESVHIYRDSLRWPGLGRQGRCAGAVLLVPHIDEETEPWFEKAFRDEHGAGVFCLTPGQAPPSGLIEWLREGLGWMDPPGTSADRRSTGV